MANKIECAYSKCKKKFTPKSAKQQYCCDVHRVYGNRESKSTNEKSAPKNAFDSYCASIGAKSSDVLAWVKVNYPKKDAMPSNRKKKEMWKQTEIPVESPVVNRARELTQEAQKDKVFAGVNVSKVARNQVKKESTKKMLKEVIAEVASKKEPPKTGGSRFLEERRRKLLGS